MRLAEFDYALPEELIAQRPAPERAASRLLRLDAASGRLEDLAFADLPSLVGRRDTLRAPNRAAGASSCSSSASPARARRWR
jgi:S-adenosylmethionine:tRNA-ribosyltransferase-isomerase (queuine synthetase)